MQLQIAFFRLVLTYLYHTVYVDCSLVDKQSFKAFPYCGTVTKAEKANTAGTSRVVNSETPINDYRWVVFIARRSMKESGDWKPSQCTGSVITDKHAITSAHCIVKCLASYQNQIVPGKNEIKVAGGGYENKWIDLFMMPDEYEYSWDIDTAYAYSVDLDTNNVIAGDIGIVGLKLNRPEVFFEKSLLAVPSSLRTARIIPLCLGKAELDLANREITGVGWGLIYDEAPYINKPKPRDPIYSSCMTSQASPHQWRFQNCDMRRMKNPTTGLYKCDLINEPPDYTPGQVQRCQKIFQKISNNDVFDGRPLKDIMEKVDIYRYNDDIVQDATECYNPNLLKKHGWCYLKAFPEDPSNPGKEAWGICSPGCDPEILKTRGFKDDFSPQHAQAQVMQWKKANQRYHDECKREIEWFDEEVMICMHNQIPETKVFNYMSYKFEPYEVINVDPSENVQSYIDGCKEDSGSGQFIDAEITTDGSKDSQYALVAIYKDTQRDRFLHNGEYHNVPCGTFSYDTAASQRENRQVYLKARSVSVSTTNIDILVWIKMTTGICTGPKTLCEMRTKLNKL